MYSGRMREWIGKLFQTSPAWNYKMSEMFLDSRLHETSLNIIEITTSPFHLVWNSPPTLAVTQCIWNKQIPMCEKILAHGCGIERMMAAAGGCLQFSLTISVKISTLIAATHRIHQTNVGKYTSPMDSTDPVGKKIGWGFCWFSAFAGTSTPLNKKKRNSTARSPGAKSSGLNHRLIGRSGRDLGVFGPSKNPVENHTSGGFYLFCGPNERRCKGSLRPRFNLISQVLGLFLQARRMPRLLPAPAWGCLGTLSRARHWLGFLPGWGLISFWTSFFSASLCL